MNICIAGAGNLGTALGIALQEKHKIAFYSIEEEVNEQINTTHENRKYLPGFALSEQITATNDPSVFASNEIILLCVPSAVMEVVCNVIKPFFRNQMIISLSKGISADGKVMTQIIDEILDTKSLALSGPCIAKELAQGQLTKVTLAGNTEKTKELQQTLSTDTFVMSVTSDIIGVQLLGFYKNIITVGIGICLGLDIGENCRSAFVAKAYRAFFHLNKENIHAHSFLDMAGLGDLYVTTTSSSSRNQRFGRLIGEGKTIEEARQEIGQTIEGYENLKRLSALADHAKYDEELITMLLTIINNNHTRNEKRELIYSYVRPNV